MPGTDGGAEAAGDSVRNRRVRRTAGIALAFAIPAAALLALLLVPYLVGVGVVLPYSPPFGILAPMFMALTIVISWLVWTVLGGK